MKADYRKWLEQQGYAANTVVAQLHRSGRVEQYHGDLDEHFDRDRMASLIESLRYSTDDERRGRPNPSKIPFDGNIRNNLASYRSAVQWYARFRSEDESAPSPGPMTAPNVLGEEGPIGQRVGLERDMQAALRSAIAQLESGLEIVDDGAERSVNSGFIDIAARDRNGATVVIERKAGVAGQQAVAQILSYMGDIVAEDEATPVRGILVASGFDSKAKAAARIVPSLALRKYAVHFTFEDGAR